MSLKSIYIFVPIPLRYKVNNNIQYKAPKKIRIVNDSMLN